MSARVTFVEGMSSVSFTAPDAIVEQIGMPPEGGNFNAQRLVASECGLEIHLPGRIVIYKPQPTTQDGLRWPDFFAVVVREVLGGRTPDPTLRISFSGVLIAGFIAAGGSHFGLDFIASTRAHGRPHRLRRWDAVREELYARILERQQHHGESLRDAIWSTAKVEPERFRRAFGGKLTVKRVEAAVSYFKRHRSDTK